MPTPTDSKWLDTAHHFEITANVSNCIGAVDGIHITIFKPQESGSMFYNYKGYYSFVLMAVVYTNYNFVYIDVAAYGKDCDSNVFKET